MSLFDSILWLKIRAFAAIRSRFWRLTGVRIKGLGFLLRLLRSDHDFDAMGFRWHLDHRIASAYASLLEGIFLEAETHAFLQFVAAESPKPFTFIDVGANIGEMVVDMARRPNVSRLIAFEPHPVCASVCAENLRLNGLAGEVRTELVGDGSEQVFVIDERSPQESGIRSHAPGPRSVTTRLDDVLKVTGEAVLLIDVEGAELDVIRGATSFIQKVRPLIIFEYHDGTRQHFTLDDVHSVLGADYQILRLRSDGKLDGQVEKNTWNCVAVSKSSQWLSLCRTAQSTISPAPTPARL